MSLNLGRCVLSGRTKPCEVSQVWNPKTGRQEQTCGAADCSGRVPSENWTAVQQTRVDDLMRQVPATTYSSGGSGYKPPKARGKR
jgi:hypothetical protein